MPPPPRMHMPGGHGVAVKLEDLVSHDRARVPNGRAVTPGPGGLTSMPLNTSQPPDPSRQTFGGVAADLNGAQQAGPSEFIKKLYKMLEEESAMYGRGKAPGQPRGEGAERGSVGWGRGGTSFVVWDMNEFTTKVL